MLKKGFTIVELLVVVVVIGILSALALPQYQLMLERSRVVEGVQILGALRKAQEVYYAQYARYESGWAGWNNPGALLVDIPQAKYFWWAPVWWAPVGVALVKRNSTDNASYGNYYLQMDPDGTITCGDLVASGICSKLGYASVPTW